MDEVACQQLFQFHACLLGKVGALFALCPLHIISSKSGARFVSFARAYIAKEMCTVFMSRCWATGSGMAALDGQAGFYSTTLTLLVVEEVCCNIPFIVPF